jgi:hypothetical protein
MSGQKEDVIIGLFWFREENIIFQSSKSRMKIKSSGTIVRFRNRLAPSKTITIHRISVKYITAVIQKTKKAKD